MPSEQTLGSEERGGVVGIVHQRIKAVSHGPLNSDRSTRVYTFGYVKTKHNIMTEPCLSEPQGCSEGSNVQTCEIHLDIRPTLVQLHTYFENVIYYSSGIKRL